MLTLVSTLTKAIVSGAGLLPRGLLHGKPKPATLSQRLGMLPLRDAPIHDVVTLHWNNQQVPFIDARHDEDVATALGVVHAHLRLGQMEAFRRIALGTTAEILGPLTADLDRSVRILGLGRSADVMLHALPAETRHWMEAFTRGVNHVIAKAPTLPYEFRMLGIDCAPWTVKDSLAIWRLNGADIGWSIRLKLLDLRRKTLARDNGAATWTALWRRVINGDIDAIADIDTPGGNANMLAQALDNTSFHGSNATAVAGAHTASNAALLVGDPHLGITTPCSWLLSGFRSPSYHAVGLMVPGLPFLGIGRSPHLAWGGTHTHAATSDFFDVSGLDEDAFELRTEPIKVRWGFNKKVRIRESPYGPMISDAPLIKVSKSEKIALRWVGQDASDELTPILNWARAERTEDAVADAVRSLKSMALPGLNMLFADDTGAIGRGIGVRVPWRDTVPPDDLIQPTTALVNWNRFADSTDLPHVLSTRESFQVSANDRPDEAIVPVGLFFASPDRRDRLAELVEDIVHANGNIAAQDLPPLHTDVSLVSVLSFRDHLLEDPSLDTPLADGRSLLAVLRNWDGSYPAASEGALAFELLVFHLAKQVLPKKRLKVYLSAYTPRTLILEDILAAPTAREARRIKIAALRTAADMGKYATWGDLFRLRLRHPFAKLPFVGKRFHLFDAPANGTRETLSVNVNAWTNKKHASPHGAVARYLCDMGDLDANSFVLLGGQDGWLGSDTQTDQAALWQQGGYITLPLRLKTVQETFPHKTVLLPAP